MKQSSIWIVLLALLLSCLTGCADVKYPAGRDTKESYGDGTYQLLKFADGTLSLSNEEYHTLVLSRVVAIREQDGKVYAIGEQKRGGVMYEAYAVVDLETNQLRFYAPEESVREQGTYFQQAETMQEDGTVVFCRSFSDFAEEDATILQEMLTESS